MTTADNRSDEAVGMQGLIHSMLSRQEQQFQKLFRENQLQNHFISTQLGEISKKLTSLGADPRPISIQTLLTAPSAPAHPDLSFPEASLGLVQSDNTDLPHTQSPGDNSPGAGKEAWMHSAEVSLDVANPEQVPGQSLLQGIARMEEQLKINLELEDLKKDMGNEEMHMHDNRKIEQGLIQDVRERLIDDNQELGQNLAKDLGENRMLNDQEKEQLLMQDLERQMQALGTKNPMESFFAKDNNPPGDDTLKIEQGLVQDLRERLIDGNQELGQNLAKDLGENRMLDDQEKEQNLVRGMEIQMQMIGTKTPMESIATKDNNAPGDDTLKIEQGLVQDLRERLIDGNQELGQNPAKDLGENRMLDDQEKEQNLVQGIERQMQMIGTKTPMESIATKDNNAPGDDAITALKQKIRLLEANAQTSEFRCTELEERNQQLQASFTEQQLKAQQCREQAETANGRANIVRAETSRLQAQTNELEQIVRQRDEKLASLQDQKDQLQRVLDAAESKRDGQSNKNKEMMVDWMKDKEYFEKKVEKQESKINELRLKADNAEISQNQYDKLKVENRESDLDRQKLYGQCQQWHEWSNKVNSDLQLERTKSTGLQQQLKDATGTTKEYERLIREKGDKIEEKKRQVESLEGSVKAQQVSSDCLEGELEFERNTSKSLREEKNKAESDLDRTKQELRQLQIQIEAKKNEEQIGLQSFYYPGGAQGGPPSMYGYSSSYYPSSSPNDK